MMRRFLRALLIGSCTLAASMQGCKPKEPWTPKPIETERVVRTTAPHLGSLTESITNGLVPVEMRCPEGTLPSMWRPTPEQVMEFQRAALIVTNGASYESWIQSAPLPQSRVVRSAESIEQGLLIVRGESHSHGPQGEHAHDVVVGHTWLDPINARSQASVIADALIGAFPEHEETFEQRLVELSNELERLHERLEALTQNDIVVLASDQPFGYLCRRYRWNALGTSADQETIERLIADEPTITVLIVSDEELPFPEQQLTDLEIELVTWKTGERAQDPGFLQLLDENITRLESAIERAKAP